MGVLGCIAERLKTKLLQSNNLVGSVLGPDAYRDLPILLRGVHGSGGAAVVSSCRTRTFHPCLWISQPIGFSVNHAKMQQHRTALGLLRADASVMSSIAE